MAYLTGVDLNIRVDEIIVISHPNVDDAAGPQQRMEILRMYVRVCVYVLYARECASVYVCVRCVCLCA